MLANLRAELDRKRITNVALARLIGCTERTVVNKVNGDTEFTLGEALKISENLFPEFELRYLFKDMPTAAKNA